jgi:glutathionylspermidine synthase
MINAWHSSLMDGHHEHIASMVREENRHFKGDCCGRKIKLIKFPLPFPLSSFLNMTSAIDRIISIQKNIISRFTHVHGRRALFDELHLDPAPYDLDFDIEELFDVGRTDLLLDRRGRPWICEFNFDSSIGGAEIASFHNGLCSRILNDDPRIVDSIRRTTGLSMNPAYTDPCDDMARLVADKAREHRCTRVVLLDLKEWIEAGYFSMNVFRSRIAQFTGEENIRVEPHDETTYVPHPEDLVFRLFPLDDRQDLIRFMAHIKIRSKRLISPSETDIGCSKMWLALLQSSTFRDFMSAEETVLVDCFIPHSFQATKKFMPQLIKNKNALVFKSLHSYGGKGVVIGRNTSTDEVEATIGENPESWICQRLIEPLKIKLMNENDEISPASVVLGIYKAGTRYSGPMIRASYETDIVNVSKGAMVGYAFLIA